MKNILEWNGLCQYHHSPFTENIRKSACCLLEWSRIYLIGCQIIDCLTSNDNPNLLSSLVMNNHVVVPVLAVCSPLGKPYLAQKNLLEILWRENAACRGVVFVPRINHYGALFANFHIGDEFIAQVEIDQFALIQEIDFFYLQTESQPECPGNQQTKKE